MKVIVQGNIRLLDSYPHHIVYLRPSEPIQLRDTEEVIGPVFGDTTIFPEGDDYEPDGEDSGTGEGEAEIQEPEERQESIITINPPSNSELYRPVIKFSVKVIGYPLWKATIEIYPVGKTQPIKTYTNLYPSNQTSVSVSWDEIFSSEKPPTGIYTYNIIVEGIPSPLLPTMLLSSKTTNNKDERLSKNPFIIRNFNVSTQLNPGTGSIDLSMSFQVLNEDGTVPEVVNARVELRNFQKEKMGEVVMQKVEKDKQVWWEGRARINLDAPEKLGLWRLVACADVKEGDNVKVVREVEKQLLIQVQVKGVAFGFRVWREGQPLIDERERIFPYEGDRILFRSFLRVKWQVTVDGQGSNQVYWYSSDPVPANQLDYYSWIAHYAWENGVTMFLRPQGDILSFPQSLLNLLNPNVTWRRFYNYVIRNVSCGEGQRRWYGMRFNGVGKAFVYQWIAETGTSWWGAKVEWWNQQNGENGNAVRYKMAFLYPTNQRGGRHLIRLDQPLNFNRGYRNQIVWTPNPWRGRISVRRRWSDEIHFDENDPFFANYTDPDDRNNAMIRQAELHRRILEWAYSFINVPYSWDGRSYGGYQSTNEEEYTCSGCNIGDGRGYGIDCSEFISIAAELGGRPKGPRHTSGLARTTLARTLLMPNANVGDGISYDEKGWIYVRPGDFAVIAVERRKHVFYARGRAVMAERRIVSLPTIEAAGDIPTPVGTRGMVREYERTEGRDNIGLYLPRRWIVP